MRASVAEGMSSFTIWYVFFLKKSIFRARAMAEGMGRLPQRPKYNMDMEFALSRDAIRAILVVSRDIEFWLCVRTTRATMYQLNRTDD
jgi:hypothetical protein